MVRIKRPVQLATRLKIKRSLIKTYATNRTKYGKIIRRKKLF